ncbi:ArsO family NAD(P)H-dependent flavin-containing monooxygenase [Chitinophaga arvensicola]|uniref:Pyridine nucleotide-disulphide oxidoreductase n=1 Tax=Chitinophaga arvensicola TaxID=29529 RepID=A0A1I0RRZ0_9BACT|nr:ArsO family NAD(P)H-dependent flavin-containing monooxygenase [Chitinophaga arvensicola]SEW44115.1 Pyridine nucleotide-disulphide oxidoreductase [Chitinophaga arvensicola]
MDKQETGYDVIVIGGGQSALAVGYFLRRTNLRYLLLDSSPEAGGAWQYAWDSLHLFSPAQWSSLPGILMPGGTTHYPSRAATISYLQEYEQRYQLPVKRPVTVYQVTPQNGGFELHTSAGSYTAKVVISATGTYAHPFIPEIAGAGDFKGVSIHSSSYRQPDAFAGKRTAIIGEGNSGAQILAEVSKVTDTLWITTKEPVFLPDNIDGKFLFDAATQQYEAKKLGKAYQPLSLGDIVAVPVVQEARARGVYQQTLRPFQHFSSDGLVWPDGHEEKADAVIFCTGFKPALQHLAATGIVQPSGKVATNDTRVTGISGLWLVGYGNWTGFASATLIGVGRSARKTVEEVKTYLEQQPG